MSPTLALALSCRRRLTALLAEAARVHAFAPMNEPAATGNP
jgi:hypothetical protein